jgi:hypothetical protein
MFHAKFGRIFINEVVKLRIFTNAEREIKMMHLFVGSRDGENSRCALW